MFLITHSIIAMFSITFLLGLVYFYIFFQNHKRYIGFWGFSWMVFSLSFVFDFWKILGQDSSMFIVEKQMAYLISSISFLFATYDFLGQSTPKFWIPFSIISILCISTATLFSSLFLPLTLHTSILICFISIWTGLLFILHSWGSRIAEKYITGFFFIIWGIYKGYYPFIQPEFWLAPWSYVGGAVLTNILGILILLIYFKKNEIDLSHSEKRFRLLAENAPDFIYRYRYAPTPGFDYISPAVVRIMDYTPEELYADPEIFFRQVHPEDQPILEKTLRNPGKSLHEPIILRRIRKDGLIVWTEQHYSIIRDASSNVVAIEGILRDITERKLTEENLFRLEKFRRDLLGNISHELKTPITSIQGYIEAILDGVIVGSENFTKYLKLIHTRTLGLNRLIQDLIQLTQLETKQIDFQMYEMPVLDLLEQIHNKYELDIQKAGLHFEMHPISCDCHQSCNKKDICCNARDLVVTIDPDRIDQVFSNLIFNAIKHTNAGGVISMYFEIIPRFQKFVDCRYKDNTKNTSSIIDLPKREFVIKIQDTGCGINPEDLPHIFDRFYKGSNTHNHLSKGSGLGLSIAKEIVQTHGGRIWVQSKINQGSTFCFTLPIHSIEDHILARDEVNTSIERS